MSPQFQILLQQGIQAFQNDHLDSANSILKKVLQIDSKNLPALHILGLIKLSQENYKEGANLLSRASQINPNDASIEYNLAKALVDCGSDKESLPHHKKAVQLDPNNAGAWLNYGKTVFNLKRYDEALIHYDRALKLKPNYAEAWLSKGNVFYELKRYDEALINYDQALQLKPDYAEAYCNKGNTVFELKRHEEALALYDQALIIKPDYAEACRNKGNIFFDLEHYDQALALYDQALIIKPDYAEACCSKGKVFYELKRYDEALTLFDQALKVKPDYAEALLNKGNIPYQLKRHQEALRFYERALTLQPDFAEAWINKGNALDKLGHPTEALAHYDKALNLNQDSDLAWVNKGNVLCNLNFYDEAIDNFDRALKLKPNSAGTWLNKANALHQLLRYSEALTNYQVALDLKPDLDWVNGDFFHLKMKISDWSNFNVHRQKMLNGILANEKIISPLPLLALTDDAALLKNSAEIFAQEKYPSNPILGGIPKRAKKNKIRLGYFSPDFQHHPVAYLISELFEIHDRNHFEVFAFSLKAAKGSDDVRKRLKKGVDNFIEVENMGDLDVAKMARALEIDIAIDLSGPTLNSRTSILSYRVAPIQVNWLGFAGTIGAEFIDYIVADGTVIPESSRHSYVEKVAYLPNTYMVDDTKRVASSRVFSKEEFGLPENTFIFCCFNNGYKFNPQLLDSWSRILLATPFSVIWITDNCFEFCNNITIEFKNRGVNSSRLIFSKKLDSMAEHLARYTLADLFLDTHPYNAHTTALDCLKAGTPFLTRAGNSFASRVGASVLNAIGLPELVTNSEKDYEALAIELASNPKKLLCTKNKLIRNRITTPLFNTALFTKNLESAYTLMYERYQADLEPDHLFID